MPTSNESIHRATITLDVPAKIADVIVYAKNIVQVMTNNPRAAVDHGLSGATSYAPRSRM